MKRRRTKNRVAVAQVLLRAPDGRHWAYDIAKALDLVPAKVMTVLKAMREDGWLTVEWEDPEKVTGRPPRRYYTLTDLGRAHLPRLAR